MVESKKSMSRGYVICFIAALFYCFQCLVAMLPSIEVRPLMVFFHANGTQVGYINSAFYYTFIVFLFLCGPIVDRFPSRLVMGFSCGLSAVATYTAVISHNIVIAYISRAIMGAGTAFSYPLMLYLIEAWLNKRWFTFYTSIYTASSQFFIVIYTVLLVSFLAGLSIVILHAGLAILGIVFAILGFFVISDNNYTQKSLPLLKMFKSILLLMWDFRFIHLSIMTMFLFVSITMFCGSWGVEFSKDALHFSEQQAMMLNAILFLGVGCGIIFFGILADWLGYRKWQLLISSILIFCILMILLYVNALNIYVVGILYVLLGFLNGVCINVFYFAKVFSKHEVLGAAIGIITAFSILNYLFLPPLIGWMLDNSLHVVLVSGVRVYTRLAFQQAFIFAPIASVLAILLLFFFVCV